MRNAASVTETIAGFDTLFVAANDELPSLGPQCHVVARPIRVLYLAGRETAGYGQKLHLWVHGADLPIMVRVGLHARRVRLPAKRDGGADGDIQEGS
jgi:hypothetical protein